MKALCFDKNVIANFLQHSEYFSIEFEQGLHFIKSLRGKEKESFSSGINCIDIKDCLFYFSEEVEKTIVVFDLETSNILNNNDGRLLHILQKIFRFSIKYWNNLGFTNSEYIISDTQKAAVFPFPRNDEGRYRVVIEREPDPDRLLKRDFKKTLLVYKTSYEGVANGTESAPLKNIRIVVDNFQDAVSLSGKMFADTRSKSTRVQTTEIEMNHQYQDRYIMPYDAQMGKLSITQKKVLENDIFQPLKIKGAAGTGKTTVMIMKAVHELKKHINSLTPFDILFITHSKATEDSIKERVMTVLGESIEKYRRNGINSSLTITTLQDMCIQVLNNDISINDVLDSDAYESKKLQMYFVQQAFDLAKKKSYSTYQNGFSADFSDFILNTDELHICALVAHEISILIKGQASGMLERYKTLSPLKTGLPAINDYDKSFVYCIFIEYQNFFDELNQFDSDDIAITAYGRLDSPLWKRKRREKGSDLILLDEAHLFNVNELQLIHYLSKKTENIPIVFAFDLSQSIGEHGIDQQILQETVCDNLVDISSVDLGVVFRNNPAILELAAAVTASGALLFNNFDNPYASQEIQSIISEIENYTPKYHLKNTEMGMFIESLDYAKSISNSNHRLNEVCFVVFDRKVQDNFEKFLQSKNISPNIIQRRGDSSIIENQNKFVVTSPDYVGGLEFDHVILLGVDNEHVPESSQKITDISRNFLRYRAINRLYVTISRARKTVTIWGIEQCKISECLEFALQQNFLEIDA